MKVKDFLDLVTGLAEGREEALIVFIYSGTEYDVSDVSLNLRVTDDGSELDPAMIQVVLDGKTTVIL